jgi:alpha-amylase
MNKKILLLIIIATNIIYSQIDNKTEVKSDVYMQGFYWNSPPGGIWYDSLAKIAPQLSSAGFSGIWFPSPVKGAGGGFSMGYDPYDHYDFGEYYQQGSTETRFGSRQELVNAINAFHQVGIEVYADAVMNHMNGGEEKAPYECKPYLSFPDSGWLIFNYPYGSKRFKKNAAYFYPNSQTCDVNPPYHGAGDPLFQFGEWLAHDRTFVRDSLIVWGKYLKQVLGFDGFRLDAVKGIDPMFIGAWISAVNNTGYNVAEYYGSTSEIGNWLHYTQNVYGGNVSMFDFPLRFTFRDMCNNTSGTFDMNNLDNAGLINAGISGFDVSTFVENHDLDRMGWDGSIDNGHDPIITNKDMAYAYILFSEGRPTVFYKDYFDYGFAGKIDTLIWIRKTFLYGGTTKRSGLNPWYLGGNGNQNDLSKNLYIARREGGNNKPQVFLVLNNHPTEWRGVWVSSNYPNKVFRDYTGRAIDKTSQNDGRVELWAPPRGYAIYVPDTTQFINHVPVLQNITDKIAYTGSFFSFKPVFADADNDNLTFTITNNPNWLAVSNTGVIYGTPKVDDIGESTVIFKVTDIHNAFAIDTFKVTVLLNRAPVLTALSDTVAFATKRFERKVNATDPDNDTLRYFLIQRPNWLNIEPLSGLLSGTPAPEDTGYFNVSISVTDNKGVFDTTSFGLTVKKSGDTLIATYGKPKIDGNISVSADDWLSSWLVIADSNNDSFWRTPDSLNNEIFGIYATWDSDSLYLGINYYIKDKNNTMILYMDTKNGGVTNFNSAMGYNGEYPKNFRFRAYNGIDLFTAAYYLNKPSAFKINGNSATNISSKINSARGANGYDSECAIAWNDIYDLGAGIVPVHAEIKMVAVVAGGFNWGGGDSAPDNIDVDGNSGPDSLINLATISFDNNGDGIPDPTVFISEINDFDYDNLPANFKLYANYPNPFNPSTNIVFALPKASHVKLVVYDILGREVATVLDNYVAAGYHNVKFNAFNLASGIYFYALKTDDNFSVKKMLLLK